MADELEQLTENAAGTGWVDAVPGNYSTGYAPQNVTIQAGYTGMDHSSVSADGADVVIAVSGPIDVDGILFPVKSQVTLTPASVGTYYIRVIPGSAANRKSLELTTETPTFSAVKNALYDSSDRRVLNWKILYTGGVSKVYRIDPIEMTFGSGLSSEYPFGFVKWTDLLPALWGVYSYRFDAPAAIPQAVFVDPGTGNLLIAAGTLPTQKIYVNSGVTGSNLTNFTPPGSTGVLVTDICVAPSTGNFICCKGATIYICDGISGSVLNSFSAPGSDTRGVHVQESSGNLLSLDGTTDTLSVHDGITSTVTDSISLSVNGAPRSLCENPATGGAIFIDYSHSTKSELVVLDGVSETEIGRILLSDSYMIGVGVDGSTGRLIGCETNTDQIYLHGPVIAP